MSEYKIPAGTKVSICKADDEDRQWNRHVTKREAYGEHVDGNAGAMVLLVGDYLILTRRQNLVPGFVARARELFGRDEDKDRVELNQEARRIQLQEGY